MSISDEIEKLVQLREQGVLSPEEFEQAKRKILDEDNGPSKTRNKSLGSAFPFDNDDESVGKAANRYVSFQIIMSVVGLVVFIFIFLVFFAPAMCSSHSHFDGHPHMRFP